MYRYLVCCQVISQLKVLMRSNLEASKFDKEKWSTELSPILNLWKKLNQVHLVCIRLHGFRQTLNVVLLAVIGQLQDTEILTCIQHFGELNKIIKSFVPNF